MLIYYWLNLDVILSVSNSFNKLFYINIMKKKFFKIIITCKYVLLSKQGNNYYVEVQFFSTKFLTKKIEKFFLGKKRCSEELRGPKKESFALSG